VECRSTNGKYTFVFTFSSDVVSGSATVTSGTGRVKGSPIFSGNTMTVNLTGVTDVQKITVTLSNVTSSTSQVLPDTAVSANMVIGDTDGDKTVSNSDVRGAARGKFPRQRTRKKSYSGLGNERERPELGPARNTA
jgi:hypothetical protein